MQFVFNINASFLDRSLCFTLQIKAENTNHLIAAFIQLET